MNESDGKMAIENKNDSPQSHTTSLGGLLANECGQLCIGIVGWV